MSVEPSGLGPLTDRVALVTGASSGQGRAFALALGAAGVKVFAVARREERLRTLVDQIAAEGGEAAYHVTDVPSNRRTTLAPGVRLVR